MRNHPDSDDLIEAVYEKWTSEEKKKATLEHMASCRVCTGMVERERARLKKAGLIESS